MYGIVSTSKLDEAIQGEEEFKTYIRESSLKYMQLLRDLGVLDIMVIRTGVDTMVHIAIFESATTAVLALNQSEDMRREHNIPEMTTLISRVAGEVNDMPAGFVLDGYSRADDPLPAKDPI